jgi:hypothetical protein
MPIEVLVSHRTGRVSAGPHEQRTRLRAAMHVQVKRAESETCHAGREGDHA